MMGGLTVLVPPVAARLYELPSLPEIVTCVELVALTVRLDEFPAGIDEGFAVMLAVGATFTVTVAVAVTVPPVPVAVAVYVVVPVGFTDCVPPEAARVYELLSVPVTVTAVAFAALTVSVEDPPEAIEDGLAEMLTVGADAMVTVAVAVALPPVPVAVAVYVVDAAVGLTDCVPPVALRL